MQNDGKADGANDTPSNPNRSSLTDGDGSLFTKLKGLHQVWRIVLLVAVLTLCGVVVYFTLPMSVYKISDHSDVRPTTDRNSRTYTWQPIAVEATYPNDLCIHQHYAPTGSLRLIESDLTKVLAVLPKKKAYEVHYKISATVALTTESAPQRSSSGFIALVLDQIPNRTAIIYLLCNCNCGRQQIRMLHGVWGDPEELAANIADQIASSQVVNFFVCSQPITELGISVDFDLSAKTLQIENCQPEAPACTLTYYNWVEPSSGINLTSARSFLLTRGLWQKSKNVRQSLPWNLTVSLLPWCEVHDLKARTKQTKQTTISDTSEP
ncbi:hypothetical protein BIW11_10511 [Tropilaelaps mercedesae]|uniref:Uncharacterized protein n=1 Tax=Tropilaelaps mercedesae TaxID=418985 RepID=A0A1V9XFC9_9ACAR|nr:hypothetical protein BIW11_10511 [Tropilaelaps mercedesae]